MARRSSAGGDLPAPPADGETQPEPDPESVARTICLRLLTIRARTRQELSESLAARDVPPAAAERVLDRLTDVGLIDDAAFAAEFVSSRRAGRALAGREIGRQLRDKGVADVLVADALVPVDRESELASAQALVGRRRRSIRHLPPDVQTRRLIGLLARKGYSPELSYQVVRSALDVPYDLLPDGDTL